MRPTIFHIDMDAFYAAIEQRDNPALRGLPVIVGSPPDKRGVVCTCSYEARRYGVRSAMPSRTAYARCPEAVFIRPRMDHYAAVSRQLMDIFREVTPKLEKLSIDEAFLDVSDRVKPDTVIRRPAQWLKDKIQKELGLTASIGVAPNKFLAKLASDLDKPDGLTITPWEPDAITAFLAPFPVTKIWGVGKVTAQRLKDANLSTIGDIQHMGETYLQRLFSKTFADHLWNLAHGVDPRRVETEHEEKSISNEETFAMDCADPRETREILMYLVRKVGSRLRAAQKTAATIYIKVRFSDFRTITRQRSFDTPVCQDAELAKPAGTLFDALPMEEPVRLIGFGASGLMDVNETTRQPDLFTPTAAKTARRSLPDPLRDAVNELRNKFGQGIISKGMPANQRSVTSGNVKREA
ncbi:MAG: DNA polymerase IV [Lentisphaeria bacterium]|nr:DNA polymerase IV [Lentisphaeria bacterium]